MRRSLISALLVLLAAILIVGLTLSKSTSGRADFTFINGSEPKTLDPQLMTGEPEGRVAESLFEGLTRLEARTLQPVPGVAESWDISPDGKTYTFHLRQDARWSDGRPVTAQDFTYAWRRLQAPATAAEYAYIMHVVRYAEALNTHEGQAEQLEGPVLKAVDGLIAKHAATVPAAALKELAQKQSLDGVLKGTPNPALRAFLLRKPGDLATAELAKLRAELVSEGARRRSLYREANQHYGIDGGVFAKDARTLVVELVAPTPYFLELTAFYPSYPAPRWAIEAKDSSHDWFLPGKIVSNGAFNLAVWRVGDRIRLERSQTYWGRADVALATADLLPIENLTTGLNLYLTGEVDWLPSNYYPQDLGPYLRQRPDFYSGPALITYYYRINCTRKPFDDVRVRKALNLAIDRAALTRDVTGMGQIPGYYFVPPGIRGYERPETSIRYDVAEARRLLAEAGFADGRGFPKFGVLYNTTESHKKIAEFIADQLHRNLNLSVSAYNQEWQSYQQSYRSLDYDLSRAGWVGDYEDPNTFLDIWITNGGNNATGWGNLVYDRLLEAAGNVEQFLSSPEFLLEHAKQPAALKETAEQIRASSQAEQRLAGMTKLRLQLLSEAEAILVHDEFPLIPLYFYLINGMVKPNVKGFYAKLES
ncbi:MAG TPA: peptide ABC transporter substrate-binding protein, partial [Polyangiaceae bacterium]